MIPIKAARVMHTILRRVRRVVVCIRPSWALVQQSIYRYGFAKASFWQSWSAALSDASLYFQFLNAPHVKLSDDVISDCLGRHRSQ